MIVIASEVERLRKSSQGKVHRAHEAHEAHEVTMRANEVSEPRDRSEAAKRRTTTRARESEGRSPWVK
jgi:hypothetical protein